MNRLIFTITVVACCQFTYASELTEFLHLAETKDCGKLSAFIENSSDPDYFLATSYHFELCNDKDPLQALKHYKMSAQNGNTESMYSFFVTVGKIPSAKVQTDDLRNEAKEWLVRAANLKHHEAAAALSFLYKSGGFGFKKDEKKSLFYENISNHLNTGK